MKNENNYADSHDDRVFREIARRYVEFDGLVLKQELAQVKRENPLPFHPSLDQRLRRRVDAFTRKRGAIKTVALAAGAVAAWVLIAGILPGLLGTKNMRENVSGNVSEASSQDTGTGHIEMIPLAFILPRNLHVSGAEQDNGQSIYYLSDSLKDDVVLVLEKTARPPDESFFTGTAGLSEINIDGMRAYALSTGDYNLLTCYKDGITYTMTCRYDINTLAAICRNI